MFVAIVVVVLSIGEVGKCLYSKVLSLFCSEAFVFSLGLLCLSFLLFLFLMVFVVFCFWLWFSLGALFGSIARIAERFLRSKRVERLAVAAKESLVVVN